MRIVDPRIRTVARAISDDIGFTTDRYVELPEDMQNTRRHGVQVTVRRMP